MVIALSQERNLTPISPIDRQFVLLLQQWKLGLNIKPILNSQPNYYQWFQCLTKITKTIVETPIYQQTFNYPVNFPYKGEFYKTTYDLLIADNQGAIINQFRHCVPVSSSYLVNNWQTRLELWLMKEHQPYYNAESIHLVYWFLMDNNVMNEVIEYNQEGSIPFLQI